MSVCVIPKRCTKTHWYQNIMFQLSIWNGIQNLAFNCSYFFYCGLSS